MKPAEVYSSRYQKWGAGHGILIPRIVAEILGLHARDMVLMRTVAGGVFIKRVDASFLREIESFEPRPAVADAPAAVPGA